MDKQLTEQIRKEYLRMRFNEEDALPDPVRQFGKWFKDAVSTISNDPNAMTLATVDSENRPHARIVLLKSFSEKGFAFYTNYNSAKGRQLAANPNAALCFYWPEMERQIRIEGEVEKMSREESELYFNSRPSGSRIGAIASRQSQEINNREELERSFAELEKKYAQTEIIMPEWWGGYLLQPRSFEFWQGRESRLHDRLKYEKQGAAWRIKRLSP